MDAQGDQLSRLGALAEPVRQALYRFVASQPHPVSREQAAAAVDVPLHKARFHLDRLVSGGLLDVEYRRLTGRTGPGAGRPAKLYRRSAGQLSLSVPPRKYDLLADVLAEAFEQARGGSGQVDEVLARAARAVGHRLGTGYRTRSGVQTSSGPLADAAAALEEHGYEPVVEGSALRLVNCPFDRLAREHTELVCGVNRDLVQGVLAGLHAARLRARLAPARGCCCVRVEP